MSHRVRAATACMLTVVVAALLSGCVTSTKYRLAKRGTPPAPALDLKAPSAGPLELDLATVIVFKGPGSWKQEARWDEYTVTLVNHGSEPIAVESAELIDVQGAPRAPGDEPWSLEKESRTALDRYQRMGVGVAAGAGAAALYTWALTSAVASGSWLAGGAAATNVLLVGLVVPVAGLVDVGTVAVMDHNNKRAVEREFERRRLVLPRTLAPGESVNGSLFFPMTPGPQRLLLHAHGALEPHEVRLELGPLSALHLKAAK